MKVCHVISSNQLSYSNHELVRCILKPTMNSFSNARFEVISDFYINTCHHVLFQVSQVIVFRFKLSNVGMASIGGRHVCGPYLLVINLVANTTPFPPSNSNNSPATSPTGGVHSPNDSYTTRDKFRYSLYNTFFVLHKPIKEIGSIEQSPPVMTN